MDVWRIRQGGYIAVMSAVVLSVVLMALSVRLSVAGLSTKWASVYHEGRARAQFLVYSCIDVARLFVAQHSSYGDVYTVPVGDEECTIAFVQRDGQYIVVDSSAQVSESLLGVRVSIDTHSPTYEWHIVR